jgi:hypothetical protein
MTKCNKIKIFIFLGYSFSKFNNKIVTQWQKEKKLKRKKILHLS